MKKILKRTSLVISAAALALITILNAVLINVDASTSTTSASPYPWSTVTGGTTGDYIADSFDSVDSGHVFEVVTQERLLDILSSAGNYYIVFGSAKNATSQVALETINAKAKADGITKIYYFDPIVDGYQIDITDAASVFKTANGTSVNQLWTRITDLLPDTEPFISFTSSDTLLFSYSNDGTTASIPSYYSLTTETGYDSAAAATSIDTVFRGGVVAGPIILSSIRTEFAFFKRVFNGSATYFNYNNGAGATANKTGATTTELFTDSDEAGFVLDQVSFEELLNILNSPGEHVILFGASWCHNTQAIIKDVAAKAKANGIQTVYVYDTTLGNQLTFGTGDNINTVTASSSAFNSRVSVNTNTGNGNISYVYGELIKYLDEYTTENNSKENNSITYYPNGDITGTVTSTSPWLEGTNKNAVRLQLPFLISYNKDSENPVTRQWIHKNVANDGTYTEYMLELAWVLKTTPALSAGSIDGITKVDFASEAIAALDNVLKPISYGLTLSQTGTYNFNSATVGYTSQEAKTITVNNTGNVVTGALSVGLSGTNSEAYTVSKTSISSLTAGTNDTFTITPKAGLGVGTYTATVTVKSTSGLTSTFDVSYSVKYKVISDFVKVSGTGDVSSRIDADITKFIGVTLDGKVVDPQNYTVSSGSTIITLKEAYLKTLSAGTHNFEVQFDDGTANLSLTIDSVAQVTSPRTGDYGDYIIWILAGTSSIAVISILLYGKLRRKKI